MKIKLKSGKEIKLKDVSLDERDEMLDSCVWEFDKKGNPTTIVKMNATVTKWLRLGIDGDTSDEFLKSLSMQERTDIFLKMQSYVLVGEEKASK